MLPNCGSGAPIPISGRKCQLVILFPALGKIYMKRAGIRI
jgi:hypothetical protein